MLIRLLKSHPHLLAGLCFWVLTVAMTWPVAMHLNTHVTPGQQPVMTVPYLNLWTLAWNHHWLKGQADSYWDANLFYPHQKTLAYSEPQLGMGLLTFPLVFLGANTVLMYNLLLLGFIWGAGMAVYALCWSLFGTLRKENFHSKTYRGYRWGAAVIAGILYGFHFYMFAEMGVLQLLATLFLPLTFLGIHRFLNSNRWADALLFCAGFLGCWYTCAYYGLFLSVFVCCFVLKFGYRKVLDMEWKTLIRGGVTAVITFSCLAPLIVGMQSAKTAMELSRPKFLVQNLSAVLSDYLKLPQNSWLYGRILDIGSPDRSIFLGATLVCLAGIGTIAIFRAKDPKNTANKQSMPVGRGQQAQKVGFPQHYGRFYFVMAGLAFWLSFGMALTPTNATGLGVYRIVAWFSPYNLLYQFVPGFSSIRSPYRFVIFSTLFLAVLAGWGVLWLSQRAAPRWRFVLIPIFLTVVILESWPLPARLVKVPGSIAEVPRIYQHVKRLPPEATLLELPLARGPSERQLETEALFLYYSTLHWHRIVNGYSGFTPHAKVDLKKVIAESSPETVLAAFNTFGTQYVLTHEAQLNEKEKQKLEALEGNGLISLAREDTHRLYKVGFNSTEMENSLPDIATLTLYESITSPNHVTLCLYYQVDEHQCELTTPWKHSVGCKVTWYPKSEQGEPVLVSTSTYHDSKLITKTSNAVAFDLPAPPPGEYRIIVQQLTKTSAPIRSGICHIYENGFVAFQRRN
ncbi:MAG: hypothetical protein OXG97_20955 [Candidatus Poribacteria bacterium]|nr:hypothetical protein [Candidatus Poribacteria bacterium]